MVEVKFFADFRDKAGESSVELEAETAGELMKELSEKYEELGDVLLEKGEDGLELRKGVTVMVNGRNIRFLSGMGTELEDGDSLAVFPPVGGG